MTARKTITFLGSDKNAGKTTAFLFFLEHSLDSINYIVTSIGINGESIDEYERHGKPKIFLRSGQYFISKQSRLSHTNCQFETVRIFNQPLFKDVFVLAKATFDGYHILEGPNSKLEIQLLKKLLLKSHKSHSILIDGSIDRQFLCDPTISDEIYYSLLITNRKAQRQKAKQLLISHQFQLSNLTINENNSLDKVILYDSKQNILFKSPINANLNQDLFAYLEIKVEANSTLYLNCALSQKLLVKLKNKPIKIVLNNPSLLVSNLSSELVQNYNIELLQKSSIKKVFIKEDNPSFLEEFDILKYYQFHNLFQEDHHAIQL